MYIKVYMYSNKCMESHNTIPILVEAEINVRHVHDLVLDNIISAMILVQLYPCTSGGLWMLLNIFKNATCICMRGDS